MRGALLVVAALLAACALGPPSGGTSPPAAGPASSEPSPPLSAAPRDEPAPPDPNPRVPPGLVAWHADFDAARAAAARSGKPVLLFAMLGDLDRELC